ncbi:hypothetical protein GJ496_010285 [Pomphorhynchus laevis]|nr:hypothetical protein GJ496_010285 [Pomphorhynchus laevis]
MRELKEFKLRVSDYKLIVEFIKSQPRLPPNWLKIKPKLTTLGKIYLFECDDCYLKYIGKTDKQLSKRAMEHSNTIKNALMDKARISCTVSQHISDKSPNEHSIDTNS